MLQLEDTPHDRELLDALFRCAHTVKGSAGIFGLDAVVAFTHPVETLLDRLREGQLTLTPSLSTLLLQRNDQIRRLIDVAQGPDADDSAALRGREALVVRRQAASRDIAAAAPSGPGLRAAAPARQAGCWHVSVQFGAETFRNGMDPLAILGYVAALGAVPQVVCDRAAVPRLDALDKQTRQRGNGPPADDQRFIRVHADRLDAVINLLGELVTAGAGSLLLARQSRQGQLRLAACHESGNILIRISDDGRGIQRDKVLQRAWDRGLVEPGVTPADADILKLIFEPGFSTAEKVTNLSGRGVGMDVVRRNIEALRGTVTVFSEPQQGSRTEIMNVTSIVSEADKKGDILSVNEKFIEVSKFSRDELIGRPHNTTRHPDMPKETFKQRWSTIGRGETFRGVIKNRAKDGTPYYVDAVVAPIRGDNGKPMKYLGVRYDITAAEISANNMLRDAVAQAQTVTAAAQAGDLTQGIPLAGKTGPISQLCEGVNTLVETSAVILADVGRIFSALAEGDLTQRISRAAEGIFEQVKQDANASSDKLASIIEKVRSAADALTGAANQVSATAQSLSQVASEQASSVQETTASIDLMSASITQNSDNARITDSIATKASKEAGDGAAAVTQTVAAMKQIAAASQEQSQSVTQIGGAMSQLSKATQQNASASEQLAATSEELLGQAEQLQQSVAFFTLATQEAPARRGGAGDRPAGPFRPAGRAHRQEDLHRDLRRRAQRRAGGAGRAGGCRQRGDRDRRQRHRTTARFRRPGAARLHPRHGQGGESIRHHPGARQGHRRGRDGRAVREHPGRAGGLSRPEHATGNPCATTPSSTSGR